MSLARAAAIQSNLIAGWCKSQLKGPAAEYRSCAMGPEHRSTIKDAECRGIAIGGGYMAQNSDIVDLASEIAQIASSTTDPETGLRLMRLVHRLLTEAGLDPEPDQDGAGALSLRLAAD